MDDDGEEAIAGRLVRSVVVGVALPHCCHPEVSLGKEQKKQRRTEDDDDDRTLSCSILLLLAILGLQCGGRQDAALSPVFSPT
jgi:hypothetical protein